MILQDSFYKYSKSVQNNTLILAISIFLIIISILFKNYKFLSNIFHTLSIIIIVFVLYINTIHVLRLLRTYPDIFTNNKLRDLKTNIYMNILLYITLLFIIFYLLFHIIRN